MRCRGARGRRGYSPAARPAFGILSGQRCLQLLKGPLQALARIENRPSHIPRFDWSGRSCSLWSRVAVVPILSDRSLLPAFSPDALLPRARGDGVQEKEDLTRASFFMPLVGLERAHLRDLKHWVMGDTVSSCVMTRALARRSE